MAPRTIEVDDTARTVAAIDHVLTFDPDRPMQFGGVGSGKTRPPLMPAVEAMLGNATLRAALEDMRDKHDRLTESYAVLLAGAQAGVIESRTSRRSPITPISEALAALGELPGAGARIYEVLPETAEAWPGD
jgi:hypothetical protein